MIKKSQLARMKLVLSHGGPGPHKDGSSQDVHGGDRRASTTSTPDRGRYRVRPDSSVVWGVAGDPNNFTVSNRGSRGTGIIGIDFPNDRSSPTRGEVWYVEVPKADRQRGQGFAITKDVLNVLRSKGMQTVNLSAVNKEGRALVDKLVRRGEIGKKIRESSSGKAEYELLYP